HQSPLLLVPDRQAEHSVQAVENLIAPLLIAEDNHFRVAARSEDVPEIFEFETQLGKVIDFAVENHADRFLRIRHRLVAALDIDNREAPEAQSNRPTDVVALVVGTTMDDAARHLLYVPAQDRSMPLVAKLSANSTHLLRLFRRKKSPADRFETAANKGCE